MEILRPDLRESLRALPDKGNSFPEIRFGTLDELRPWAEARNEAGCGIYYSVNLTDGEGASAEHIIKVRAWICDIDGLPSWSEKRAALRHIFMSPLPPSGIVATRNGLHCYWYAAPGVPVDAFEYQRTCLGLISHFGGDPSVKDLARVLRVPGFLHRKGPPFRVEVIHDLPEYHRQVDVRAAYPAPRQRRPAPQWVKPELSDLWGLIVGAIAAWPAPEQSRHRCMLLAAGVAYKFGVDPGHVLYTLQPIVESWDLGSRSASVELRRAIEWTYKGNRPATVAGLRSLGVEVPKLGGADRSRA